MLELTRDYTKENIIIWLKEALLFFRAPIKYVNVLSNKSSADLIPQFIFYFVIYTSSYLFYTASTAGYDFGNLIKHAIPSYLFIIPTVIICCLSAWLATRSFYFKKILIFELSFSLFLTPIWLTLNSLFLSHEDYSFRLIGSIILGLSAWYSYLCLGFVIQGINWLGFKITFINLIVMNIIVFANFRIEYDNFSPGGIGIYDDPIYEEYKNLASKLKYKDTFPAVKIAVIQKGKFTTFNATMDDQDLKFASLDTNELKKFDKAVVDNISYLKSIQSTLKYTRNRYAAAKYLEYFNAVATEMKLQITDTTELYKTDELRQLSPIDELRQLSPIKEKDIKIYSYDIRNDSIDNGRQFLREYHNNIINSAKSSTYFAYLPGKILKYPASYFDWQYEIFSSKKRPNVQIEPLLPFE